MARSESNESGGGFAPTLIALASVAMNLAFVVAGAALAYLAFGLFYGLNDFATWDAARQKQMLANLILAGNALSVGLAVGALCTALVFWWEETAGYLVLVGSAILGFGIPVFYPQMTGGSEINRGVQFALALLPKAALVPAAVGVLLVGRDVVTKFVSALERRGQDVGDVEFGKGAEKANRPMRTSLLGKCWEGPYCREFVRAHCPIFLKKAACWKERRGCYCEEEIVATAAQKSKGLVLEMAPDSRYNSANTTPGRSLRKVLLTDAQKAERCRNCVIYNEHQREKYSVFLPIVVGIVLVLCGLLAFTSRHHIGEAMTSIEAVINRFSFTSDPSAGVKLTRPNDTAQWVVSGALTLMLVSKALQVLEWAVFEKKI
ncbi:MAG: hypothetical protein ACKO5K_10490 [Armatimonadota bacterium]